MSIECKTPGCTHADQQECIVNLEVQARAIELMIYAANRGRIVTIEQVPQHPLAMGNYKSVASVRPIRSRS